MFEYRVDNVTIYNNAAFDIKSEKQSSLENKLALWIIRCFEDDILEDILNKNYEGFDALDKEYILKKTKTALEKSHDRRKNQIQGCLKDYLTHEKIINIPGFVRFRLKDYKEGLGYVLDKTVEKYLCEKEYYDFLEMIKEYIKYQKPVFRVLHIVTEEKCVKYYDEYLTELTDWLEEEYSFETDLSIDDKLLTILVLTAPERIIWHSSEKSKNKELKTTLTEIFGEKLIFCNECEICGNNMKNCIDNS